MRNLEFWLVAEGDLADRLRTRLDEVGSPSLEPHLVRDFLPETLRSLGATSLIPLVPAGTERESGEQAPGPDPFDVWAFEGRTPAHGVSADVRDRLREVILRARALPGVQSFGLAPRVVDDCFAPDVGGGASVPNDTFYTTDPSRGPGYDDLFLSQGFGDGIPYTTDLRAQWNSARIGLPLAWTMSTGAGAKIAVVDTGLCPNDPAGRPMLKWVHPDLRGRVEVHSDYSGLQTDLDWRHATKVAGVAAAGTSAEGPSEGICGVAPEATIVSVTRPGYSGMKCMGALRAALKLGRDSGVRIVNCSWHWELVEGFEEDDHCLKPYDGTLVGTSFFDSLIVCSAGLPQVDGTFHMVWPAAYSRIPGVAVLAVGALDEEDTLYESNWGGWLALGAPGKQCTAPSFYGSVDQPIWVPFSGSSAAAPHVAGVAALVLSAFPALGCHALKRAVRITGVPVCLPPPTETPRERWLGMGVVRRVDAPRAILWGALEALQSALSDRANQVLDEVVDEADLEPMGEGEAAGGGAAVPALEWSDAHRLRLFRLGRIFLPSQVVVAWLAGRFSAISRFILNLDAVDDATLVEIVGYLGGLNFWLGVVIGTRARTMVGDETRETCCDSLFGLIASIERATGQVEAHLAANAVFAVAPPAVPAAPVPLTELRDLVEVARFGDPRQIARDLELDI